MSLINILNIVPKNPVTKFMELYIFEITFEIISKLKKEIKWKMLYVISDDSSEDQILGEMKFSLENQLQIGQNKFEFKGEPPSIEKIPQKDLIGAAAILLICSYDDKEIFRCGYYLNVNFDNEEMDINIPDIINVKHLMRNLLYNKPRIIIPYFEWEVYKEKKDIINDPKVQPMINDRQINDKNLHD